MKQQRGEFIVFEGINGCGKGTQLALFHNYLIGTGKAVPIFTTGEPSQFSTYGEQARRLLQEKGDPKTNGLLAVEYFSKDRKEHNDILEPLLQQGVHVLSDRYWHSTYAFQMAQGLRGEDIAERNKGLLKPDITYLIDVPVGEAVRRLTQRDQGERRKFDRNKTFLEQVRKNYFQQQKLLPRIAGDSSIVIINGNRNLESIAQEIREHHKEYTKRKNEM